MKLLITGGTGFIGSQLAREARAHGHDVVVTGLLNSAAEQAAKNETILLAGLSASPRARCFEKAS
jgi:nucleoside-diphosphate-sugar epimerase